MRTAAEFYIINKNKKAMKTTLKQALIHAALIVFIISAMGIMAQVNAQTPTQTTASVTDEVVGSRMKDADISHATNVRLTAQAIPLKASINGPYGELKPALAPNGKRLYFSRF